MRTILLFICLAILPAKTFAQANHVPNPSFEQYSTCPINQNQLTGNCTGWDIWTSSGSSDYFHTCGSGQTSVPQTYLGFQQPAHGSAYAGFIYDYGTINQKREYITRAIIALNKGYVYEVSMSVSLANTSGLATDDLSVYFFDNGPTYITVSTAPRIPVIPQIDYSSYGRISDTQNWVRLTKYLYADSAYDNIVIGGGFKNPANIDTAYMGGITGTMRFASYIFCDSIVIRQATGVTINFTDSLLCAGDTIKVPFVVDAFRTLGSNNVYTLQLSNASGSFSSPVTIGTLTSISRNDTVKGVIPTNTPTGTGYIIRLISSNNADTSYYKVLNNFNTGIKIGNSIAKPTAGNNSPTCVSDTIKLTATTTTTGAKYSWAGPGSFNSNLQNPTIASATSGNNGNYIVTANLYGCKAKDTTTVVIIQGPGGTIATSNAPVCINDTLKLFGTANGTGNTYSWTGPNSFTSTTQNPILPAATGASGGDYVLHASNGTCVSKDTVTVVVKPRPAAFSGTSNSPVCAGTSINFSASSTSTGVTYSWAGPNSFTSTSATPFISGASVIHNGDYTVTATLNGCPLKDTVTVLVNPLPLKPVANSNTPLCTGGNLNLTGATSTTGVTYSWTGPNGFTSSQQNPTLTNATTGMSGSYILTVTISGCTSADTETVAVYPALQPITATATTSTCPGDTLKLFASNSSPTGASYSWAGPNSYTATTQNPAIPNAAPTMNGDYIVTANLNGCIAKDTVTVALLPNPSAVTMGSNSPICAGSSLQLTATASTTGATYAWAGPNSFTSNTQNTSISNSNTAATGWYKLTISLNNCRIKDSILATVNAIPSMPMAAAPNSPLCARQDLQLTASTVTGAGYTWAGPSAFTANTQNPIRPYVQMNHAGKYYVYATLNGCISDTDSVAVIVNIDPVVNIFPTPGTTICPGQQATFTAIPTNGGTVPTYQWRVNGIATGGTGVTYSSTAINNGDIVTCHMTSTTTCSTPFTDTSNAISMTVLPKMTPSVTISANPNTSLHPNEPISFNATPTNAGTAPTYQWRRNGKNVGGATSAIWGANANALSDGDEICVLLKSSYQCPDPYTVLSNCIKLDIRLGIVGVATNNGWIRVYPNPVNDLLHIETSPGLSQGEVTYRVELYDVVGRKLFSQKGNAKTMTINLEKFSAGVYVIKVNDSFVERVVKE